MTDYRFEQLTTNGTINRGIVDKVIKDYEMMSPAWQEVMTHTPQYQEYAEAKKLALTYAPIPVPNPRNTVKIASLIFAIVLVGSFGMAILTQKPPTTRPMPPAPTADLPPIIDDVNRYKHDGTQPTLMQATPSQKAQVDWATSSR